MWFNMLEAGNARSKEGTIRKMLEWIGASVWHDAEVQQAIEAPTLTKRGVSRKRMATLVLDKYLGEARDNTAIENPEKLVLKSNENRPSSPDLAKIKRRKRLNNILNTGRMSRKLVQLTSLGILFDPNIWSYVKSQEKVDKAASVFQADSQKMKFISILDEQVKLLVQKGQPDLAQFLNLLDFHSIMPLREITNLRAEYGLEREPVPQSYMEMALDQLVEKISHMLGKNSLSDDDSIMVNGETELLCGMFDRFRFKKWLKCYDIAVALAMTDIPAFMKVGRSISLHKKDRKGKVTALSEPFSRWKKDIDMYRRESKNSKVYFCPVNISFSHFSLLEINEQTQMIYHYDSMVSGAILRGPRKDTIVKQKVEEAFKDLGFGYIEAPTPQQKDGWSCGLMVIRNARQRISGLSVGTWADNVDPDRVIKVVVSDLQTFLDNDAVQLNPLSKKRKMMAEGVQEPNRSSKRLKKINKAS
ncbi:hypothetical protein B0O99DRAFT_642099 [Bisporella sp. PMI_857]|nr:hypothetical protein B0O99DRAFT_642099 [Bisporella sp. PMI_857]